MSNDGSGRSINEIMTQHVRDERERPRSSEITLYHFKLRLLTRSVRRLSNDLHIERTRNLKCSGHLFCDRLQPLQVGFGNRERGENERRVARMHSSIFDVLRDGVDEELA